MQSNIVVSCLPLVWFIKENYKKNGIEVASYDSLFNVFRENDGKKNCAQVLEEEGHKMFAIKSLNDEHNCNVVSMNSLNIHDVNDMQNRKLGDAMFDEDDIFCPPSFDEQFFLTIYCKAAASQSFIKPKNQKFYKVTS